MKTKSVLAFAVLTVVLACAEQAQSPATGKYALKVPNGLAFSEFKGYEGWQLISTSQGEGVMAATLGNPEMIAAYEQGFPGNGKPIPDGAKMAKIHWNPKNLEALAGAVVPATQQDVDFMVKDSKRFGDSGGWGWAAFKYDTLSGTFTPATTADKPPQANDAKCGFGCHTIVQNKDYVFTDYAPR